MFCRLIDPLKVSYVSFGQFLIVHNQYYDNTLFSIYLYVQRKETNAFFRRPTLVEGNIWI